MTVCLCPMTKIKIVKSSRHISQITRSAKSLVTEGKPKMASSMRLIRLIVCHNDLLDIAGQFCQELSAQYNHWQGAKAAANCHVNGQSQEIVRSRTASDCYCKSCSRV